MILTFSRSGSSLSMMLLVTARLSTMAWLANLWASLICSQVRSWFTMTYLLSGEIMIFVMVRSGHCLFREQNRRCSPVCPCIRP